MLMIYTMMSAEYKFDYLLYFLIIRVTACRKKPLMCLAVWCKVSSGMLWVSVAAYQQVVWMHLTETSTLPFSPGLKQCMLTHYGPVFEEHNEK